MGVHLAVADSAEIPGLVVVGKDIVEGTLYQLSVFRITWNMSRRKTRHRGKSRNRNCISLLAGVCAGILLYGKKVFKPALDCEINPVGLLCRIRRKRKHASAQNGKSCNKFFTHFLSPSFNDLKYSRTSPRYSGGTSSRESTSAPVPDSLFILNQSSSSPSSSGWIL